MNACQVFIKTDVHGYSQINIKFVLKKLVFKFFVNFSIFFNFFRKEFYYYFTQNLVV